MTDPRPSTLSQMEQIQILLEEYKALRAEVIQRFSSAFTTSGIAGTASAAVIAILGQITPWSLILIAIIPVILWSAYRMVEYDMNLNAIRLKELETEINDLAGTRLLKWEAEHGGKWPKTRLEYVFPLRTLWEQIRKIRN